MLIHLIIIIIIKHIDVGQFLFHVSFPCGLQWKAKFGSFKVTSKGILSIYLISPPSISTSGHRPRLLSSMLPRRYYYWNIWTRTVIENPIRGCWLGWQYTGGRVQFAPVPFLPCPTCTIKGKVFCCSKKFHYWHIYVQIFLVIWMHSVKCFISYCITINVIITIINYSRLNSISLFRLHISCHLPPVIPYLFSHDDKL